MPSFQLFQPPRRLLYAGLSLLLSLLGLTLAMPFPVRAADTQLHGAMSHALWSGTSNADAFRELDALRDAGANTVRIDVGWSSLETDGKGQYSQWYVQKTDAVFARAEQDGLKVIANLWSTPCWASSAPNSLKSGCSGSWWDRGVDRYPPINNADYADAASYVVNRWGRYLAALEIWNEPNLPDQFWHTADPAGDYSALLKAAYPAAKSADPSVPVLGGAIAASDTNFLEQLYAHGVKGYFDAISFHPYNEWRDPYDPWKPEWREYTYITGVPAMHQVMVDHGDGGKGMWITEFGWSNCAPAGGWCVTTQQQADYIKRGFEIARGWPYIKAAILYNTRNKGTDPTDRESQFGLLERDFTPKPAYGAFKDAMQAYGSAAPPTASGGTGLPEVTTGTVSVTPNGTIPVTVGCTRATSCQGTVTVTTTVRRHGRRARKIVLGRRSVYLARGASRRLRITVPRRKRPLIARFRLLRATAKVTRGRLAPIAASSNTVRLTLLVGRMRQIA